MSLSKPEIKHLRGIGHNLNPIVTVGDNGLSEGVKMELERALNDHELIKVKLAIGDRDDRKLIIEHLCEAHQAELVQTIGKVALLLRRSKKPNPALSNLLRES